LFNKSIKKLRIHIDLSNDEIGSKLLRRMTCYNCKKEENQDHNEQDDKKDEPLTIDKSKKKDEHSEHTKKTTDPLSLFTYITKVFKYCKENYSLSEVPEEVISSLKLGNDLKDFCNKAMLEFLTNVQLMLKVEVDGYGKLITEKMVMKVLQQYYYAHSFDFEKSGDSKEVDNLMNAFLQSEETKKNNNKHNNAEKVSHLKKVVKSKD